MALTQKPKSTGASKKIQISVNSSTSNEVMYTVPSGKTFEGYFSGLSNSSGIKLNGVIHYAVLNSTGSISVSHPLSLIEGDVVSCWANSVALRGIQS